MRRFRRDLLESFEEKMDPPPNLKAGITVGIIVGLTSLKQKSFEFFHISLGFFPPILRFYAPQKRHRDLLILPTTNQ